MRLLIVTHYFWPENFRINDLAAELVARGHQVTVLTGLPNYPQGSIDAQFRKDPASFAQFRGVRIVRVPVIPRGKSRLGLLLNYVSAAVSGALAGSWKLRGERFDAIFVYQPSPVTTGLPGALLRFSKRAPMAMWVLDLWPQTLQAMGVLRAPRLLRLVGGLVSFIYAQCDLILAQSRSFIPQIARYARAGRRIEYFPSWAEGVFKVGETAAAAEVPPKAGVFNIMFAGNIGEAQDFPAILDAAERLKDQPHIRWLIVGDGSMAGWVREQIARHGLQESVLMLGRHPVERMPAFYKCAHALLVSLKDEPIFAMTIPGKLQSYLAAGMPVLAMLNGEGAALVERSGAGLSCNAGDGAGLAAAVTRMAALDPQQLQQMGSNALQLSTSEFDRDRLITQVERWLEDLRFWDSHHSARAPDASKHQWSKHD